MVPVTVICVPGAPIVGVKLVIVGGPVGTPEVRVKLSRLVTVFAATVTAIDPVVAVAGTVTVNCVAVAVVTVLIMPLNLTVLLAGVVLNPDP